MTHVGYIAAGWAVTFGVCGLYAVWLVTRGRAMTARVPADRRRWMTTPDDTASPYDTAEVGAGDE